MSMPLASTTQSFATVTPSKKINRVSRVMRHIVNFDVAVDITKAIGLNSSPRSRRRANGQPLVVVFLR